MALAKTHLWTATISCVALITSASVATGAEPSAAAKPEGQGLYERHCAECHGSSLAGTDIGPPLAGDFFRSQWQSAPVVELREKIALTMPTTGPGSLTPSEYDAILHFMLRENGQEPDAPRLFAGTD